MKRFLVAFITFLAVPLILLSYSSNPPLSRTGAPGESTCAGCHSGGAISGNVSVGFAGGTGYTPGTTKRLTITVNAPTASARGYELTAVQAGATSTGAGTFAAADANSGVRLGTGTNSTKSYAAQTNSGVSTYLVDWSPPATSVGSVTFYVAAVGGDGDGSEAGDSVYTANYTLTPPAAAANLSATPSTLSFSYIQNGTVPAAQNVSLASSGTALNYTVAASATWLSASPTSGTTPGTVSIAVNPAGLAPGSYNGSVTVTANGASNSPLTIPVSLTVTAAPNLTLTPSSLNFAYQVGGATPAGQSVAVASSGAALSYAVTSSATWLAATPASGSTPGSLSVSVNPSGLAAGIYNGTISVAATGAGNSPRTVAVALTVTAAPPPSPNLSTTPSSLNFAFQIGSANPAAQNVSVSSSGPALNYNVSTSTAWLSATPASGTTPGSLSVSMNPSGLAAGTYNGTVSVSATSAGNSPQRVSVTLTVTVAPPATPNLVITPGLLSFSSTSGASAPPAQNLSVTSSGAALTYTVATSGGSWLSATPATDTTGSNVSVTVNPAGMVSGTYRGTVTIAATGAGNTPQTVLVTMVIGAAGVGSLQVTPGSLSFRPYGEESSGQSKRLVVSSSGAPLSFTAAAFGGSWLSVSPSGGTTPASVTVSVYPEGLARGTYTGQIKLSASGVGSLSIPVTLSVSAEEDDNEGGERTRIIAQLYTYDPLNSGAVSANWVPGAGVPNSSSSDPANQGLVLVNNAAASSKARAGLIFRNVQGITVSVLGFDIRQGSLCTAKGPYFIIVTSDDVIHTVGGCPSANSQPAPVRGWTRFRFGAAQTSPTIVPGSIIKSIALMLDAGPETDAGLLVLDNIDVNRTTIGQQ